MRNLLICEGSTDLLLIQYFLEKTTSWEYVEKNMYDQFELTRFGNKALYKWFRKKEEEIYLCIYAAKGCTNIPNVLREMWFINLTEMEKEKLFGRIIILTDNDEIETQETFLDNITQVLTEGNCECNAFSINNWNEVRYNWFVESVNIELLPLIIPFETTGAIEDFLLNALKKKSELEDPDKLISKIVDECCSFIDNLDGGERYLSKRRERTKARFTSVFVVLTPTDAFAERKNLLQSVPWEEYQEVQIAFKELSKI
ncbi:DUF3226 domain-containing protein [Bacillus mycoides]|uniref:DUF3226 domain-containing protein n=1 Tax=Bacillus mycoides TaxID=1405 RepID=UPI0027369311|nr:DUF3226 domain-containing protein [Bacillus mycoides]